ncbi:MAG: flagellin [Alphaproteobacteria bacterium]|nr:flagellin [Alphaproteobacteria bacterium]
MPSSVTLTAALRSNLLSLQGTQRLLDSTQLRLATGRKVNSALDDPNAFFAAQSLNNRASDLSRLLDGIGQGIQTLKAADQGITSLTSLLEQAQAVAQEARDQATGGAVVTGADLVAADAADLTNNAGIANNDSFTLQLGSGPVTEFTITTGESLQDLANQINTIEGITATVEPGGAAGTSRIRLQSLNGQDITLANSTNTPGTVIFGGVGTTAATSGAPQDQTQLQASFDEILSQINDLTDDSGYRGINLLDSGNLTVNFNEDSTSSITISGVDFSATGLNINNADFSSIATIDTALNEIESGLANARAQARSFGTNLSIIQTRSDFTENLINTLKEGADKLTLADKNEEGANLLALQTSQQLGISALSLASQSNQSVLRLFG